MAQCFSYEKKIISTLIQQATTISIFLITLFLEVVRLEKYDFFLKELRDINYSVPSIYFIFQPNIILPINRSKAHRLENLRVPRCFVGWFYNAIFIFSNVFSVLLLYPTFKQINSYLNYLQLKCLSVIK